MAQQRSQPIPLFAEMWLIADISANSGIGCERCCAI
jgi:hypothetical protein